MYTILYPFYIKVRNVFYMKCRIMYFNVRYRKFLYRMFFLCSLLCFCVYILFWYRISIPSANENWITVNLLDDQSEYIDQKGIHVIVGHYLGDKTDRNLNLTDEILNSNLFDPKPNEGKNGQPVLIPSYLSAKAKQLFYINRFNLLASDRIPLDRILPDMRKKVCQKKSYDISRENTVSVVIVFHNEAWSVLLRTVKSVINRSPPYLMSEIILVDDASTRKFLRAPLSKFVNQLPIPTYVLRSPKRIGLIQARILGAKRALGKILVFLDAHCECTVGWLETLVVRIAENRTRIVCPVIDSINDETFAYVRSFERHWGAFNWNLHFRWYTFIEQENGSKNERDLSMPFKTPVMAGGLFAVDKQYFFEMGAYDEQLEIWGGENLELSFRIWQCGGSIEIAPCSHVGHVFRKTSPYVFPGDINHILYANLARVALVWMDQWKEFYFKFHPEAQEMRNQNVSSRLALRERLQCRSFDWYLKNVWPQNFMPTSNRFFGKIINEAKNECLEKTVNRARTNQPSGLAIVSQCSSELDLKQMFVLISKTGTDNIIVTDESLCLDVLPSEQNRVAPKVHIVACSGSQRQLWIFNDKNSSVQHKSTSLCLDLDGDEYSVVVYHCNGQKYQKWKLQSIPWN